MTCRLQLGLEGACITRCDLSHDARQWFFADLDQKMKVIGHPAVRVNAGAILLDTSGDHCVQQESIGIGVKDGLLVISTQSCVIEPTGKMETQATRHVALSVWQQDEVSSRAPQDQKLPK